MVINFRHVGPGGRRLDNVLILIFWEGGHITVHVRPISIALPHCRPMIPPKHAFTWSCVNQLSFIPLGSDVFWAIVAIAGAVAEVDDTCPTANFATFEENHCSWGQPVHEEKRCRGWADGTSKSSSWWAAAVGRMSTSHLSLSFFFIAGHHTRHAATFTFVCHVIKTINLSKTVVKLY